MTEMLTQSTRSPTPTPRCPKLRRDARHVRTRRDSSCQLGRDIGRGWGDACGLDRVSGVVVIDTCGMNLTDRLAKACGTDESRFADWREMGDGVGEKETRVVAGSSELQPTLPSLNRMGIARNFRGSNGSLARNLVLGRPTLPMEGEARFTRYHATCGPSYGLGSFGVLPLPLGSSVDTTGGKPFMFRQISYHKGTFSNSTQPLARTP